MGRDEQPRPGERHRACSTTPNHPRLIRGWYDEQAPHMGPVQERQEEAAAVMEAMGGAMAAVLAGTAEVGMVEVVMAP